jgi:hypothetical protein
VHLRRCDVVAQAVSWARSLQTHFWHPHEAVTPGGQDPHYDEELIGRLVATITRFEADWMDWFADNNILACEVTYEELAADPRDTARTVLDHLGLRVPRDRQLVVGHRRQADQLNASWIARFTARCTRWGSPERVSQDNPVFEVFRRFCTNSGPRNHPEAAASPPRRDPRRDQQDRPSEKRAAEICPRPAKARLCAEPRP